jgi:diguanylate cyclase (GGDEF)-like protein
LLVWNRGVEGLLGHCVFDMLGKPWTSRLMGYSGDNSQTLPETDCPMHQVLQGAGAQATEMLLKRADGRLVQVELQTMPLLDDEGRLQGAIEILRDLTRCQRRAPQAVRDLKLAASRDALTSVANRGELETQLTNLVVLSEQRPAETFSVIFLDADHFKNVNDTYGHGVGDQVLIDLARLLQQETYSGEIVGRYGGEEFVVLCPATGLEDAVRRAERLRDAIRSAKIGGVNELRVTASFGVAEFEAGDNVDSVLRRADKALYQAKQTGRDRTCWQSTIPREMPEDQRAEPLVPEVVEGFAYATRFTTVMSADVVACKLGGYVHDMQARLISAAPDRVVLRQGEGSWFGWWGAKPAQQPVELTLLIDHQPGIRDQLRKKMQKTEISVTVVPLGWIRRSDIFQFRALHVVRELKQYFASE